ncbi:MAG TPA: hypothetical protein VIK64_02245 [Anaerolineales bacterium]
MTREARYQQAMQIWPELGDKCPACEGKGCPGCHDTGVAPPPFAEWMGRLVRANNGATLRRERNRMGVRENAFWMAYDVIAETPEEALLSKMLLEGRVA